MLKKYIDYLGFVDGYIKKCFDDQKPYIHCKEGCSVCCEIGIYPFSGLEFEYLKTGMDLLSQEDKKKVLENISEIKNTREFGDKKAYHQCPFLVDKKCTVYDYRGIICRTFGLLHFSVDDEGETHYHIPSCVSYGLNYSNVYDEEKQIISIEMFEKLNNGVEPLSYNLGLKYLLNNHRTEGLDFGETKALVDWFEQ